MATSKKGYALDIFRVLSRINERDYLFYDELSEAEQKSFQPVVAMKWMMGTPSSTQLMSLNDVVNPYVFPLGTNHKGLLFQLLCATSVGIDHRYKWINGGKRKGAKTVSLSVIQQMYGYSKKHAQEALVLLTKDDVLSMAEYLGFQGDELTKIKAEFKV